MCPPVQRFSLLYKQQSCLGRSKSKCHDGEVEFVSRGNVVVKYSLVNDVVQYVRVEGAFY